MTSPRIFLGALVSFFFVCVVQAQLSEAGSYFGKIGGNDLVVTVVSRDKVNIFALDYLSRTVDVVATGLDVSLSAIGVSPRGRAYNLQVRDGIARGNFGGVSFVAPKESFVGAYYDRSGSFNGIIQDDRQNTGLFTVRFYATGKVMLLYSSPAGDLAGLGQVNAAGQVVAPMTDGSIYSFIFRPDPFLLIASNGAISVNGRTQLSFLLFGNTQSKMANIATRGVVTPGGPLTAGFVITNLPKTVLIRGVGPALAQFGVSNSCPDTQLFLYSGQTLISANADWFQNVNTAAIVATSSQVGAFPLPTSSRDSVLLVTLEPGAYTVQLAAQGTVGGEALVEVYQAN